MFSRRQFLAAGTAFAATGLLAACSSFVPDGATAPAQLSQAVIVEKINATRRANGRAPLRYSRILEQAARNQANLMAAKNTLSHDLGSTLRERVTAAGYIGAVGENVAGGHKTLESAIEGWLNSPSHRNTLLSPNFSEFGLAAARAGNGGRPKNYWAIVLGGDANLWMRGPV